MAGGLALTSVADAAEPTKARGSAYLQCDGQPNNVTAGETFARLLGAVTLLGLFAPAAETPDASARRFGAEGVAACDALLDGERAEGNPVRRLPLLLARALHRIEAKDYATAVTDVARARTEAAAAELAGNPYFERSVGLSFNLIEAEARLRAGDVDGARRVSLSGADRYPHSLYPLLTARDYSEFAPQRSPEEERRGEALARLSVVFVAEEAARLEEVGRFADAARHRDSMVDFLQSMKTDEGQDSSATPAAAALSHALAGDWDRASTLADFARTNLAERAAAGKGESNAPSVVETLDLYDIVRLAHDGRVDDARRNFAARSQWLAPSFGAVTEVNRRLRRDAPPAALFGALEVTPEAMWDKRREARLARMLESDKDNKTLFGLILPYAPVERYEALGKTVWTTSKSRMLSDKPLKDTDVWSLSSAADPVTRADAMLLHAALQAKARGHDRFRFSALPGLTGLGLVRFGPADMAAGEDPVTLDADAVIRELGEVIPSPTELARRKAARLAVGKAKR